MLTFDGRVLILRWMDPEVQGRYGTMVYVRCAAEGAKRARPRAEDHAQAQAENRTQADPAADPERPAAGAVTSSPWRAGTLRPPC